MSRRSVPKTEDGGSWPTGICAECGQMALLYVGRSGNVDACERCYLRCEVDRLHAAFAEYEGAIEFAQRSRYNVDEWDAEQWDPINAAREKFYGGGKR